MNWTKRLLILGAFLTGSLLLGGHAWADSEGNASGNAVGVTAADGSPTVQADVCGNAVGVIGDPQASCSGDQEAAPTSGGGGTAAQGGDSEGNASGNAAGISVADGSPTVQADVCGNAVGVIGDPQASCSGDQEAAPTSGGGGTAAQGGDSEGNASGNAAGISVADGSPTVQADVCGNAVGVIGDPQASCSGDQEAAPTSGGGGTAAQGGDSEGNASGNAVGVTVADGSPTVQADVCGNAVGVIGDPQASCSGDQEAAPTSGGGGTAAQGGDSEGNASGNAAGISVADGSPTVQADVCGNAVGVIGDPQASCSGDQEAAPTSGGGGTAAQGGDSEGNASGNAAGISVADGSPTVQADVCGNAVGVIGDPQASCSGDQEAAPPVEGGSPPPDEGGNPPPVEGGNPPPDEGGNPPPVEGGNPPPNEGGSPPPDEGGNPPPVEGGNPPPDEGGNPPPVEGGNPPADGDGNPPSGDIGGGTNQGSPRIIEAGIGIGGPSPSLPSQAFTGDHLGFLMLLAALMLLAGALFSLRGAAGAPGREGSIEWDERG